MMLFLCCNVFTSSALFYSCDPDNLCAIKLSHVHKQHHEDQGARLIKKTTLGKISGKVSIMTSVQKISPEA